MEICEKTFLSFKERKNSLIFFTMEICFFIFIVLTILIY